MQAGAAVSRLTKKKTKKRHMRRATSRLELLRNQKRSANGSVLRRASKKIMHMRSLQERQFVYKRTLLQDCEEGDLPSGPCTNYWMAAAAAGTRAWQGR